MGSRKIIIAVFLISLSICHTFTQIKEVYATCTGTNDYSCSGLPYASCVTGNGAKCCSWFPITSTCIKKACSQVEAGNCEICGCQETTTTTTTTTITTTTIPTQTKTYLNGSRGNVYYLNNSIANITVEINITGLNANLTINTTPQYDAYGPSPLERMMILNATINNTWYLINGTYEGNSTHTGSTESWFAMIYVTTTTTTTTYDYCRALFVKRQMKKFDQSTNTGFFPLILIFIAVLSIIIIKGVI